MKQIGTKYNEAVQLIKSAILHNQLEAAKAVNRQPLAGDLDLHDFFSVSFTHHCEILAKTDTLEERAFYIHQAATLHWDKYTLRNNLKADLFLHQSQMRGNLSGDARKTQEGIAARGGNEKVTFCKR